MKNILWKCSDKELKDSTLVLPIENEGNYHIYYVYVVRHPKRDKIIQELKNKVENFHIYAFGGIKITSDWLNLLKKSEFTYNANNEFEILTH